MTNHPAPDPSTMPEEIWAWNNPDCGLRCYSENQGGDTRYIRADLSRPADTLEAAYAAVRDLADPSILDYLYNPFEPDNQSKIYMRLKATLEKHASAIAAAVAGLKGETE